MARSEHRWIKNRLEDWGKWRRKDVSSLGYPSMTAEARIKESPGISTKPGKGPNYWPPSPRVRETEDAIRRMDPRDQLVLWCKYAQQIEPERAATICSVYNSYEYMALLDAAEARLRGFITRAA